MNLNLITANVNSFNSRDKQIEVEILLKETRPTAILLQETCLTRQNRIRFCNNFDLISNNDGRSTGILLNNSYKSYQKTFHNNIISATIALIPLNIQQSSSTLAIVSIYVPCDIGSSLHVALDELLDSLHDYEYIAIGGDFNSRNPMWGDSKSNINGVHLAQWYIRDRFLDFDIVAPGGPTRPSSGSHVDFFYNFVQFSRP